MDLNNINRLGAIYVITNIINGKQYVGQTFQKLSRRMSQHRTDKRPYPISLAIRKYGWENFTVEIIATSKIRETLDALESHLIIVMSVQKPFGYNLKPGGNSSSCSEETREKLRKAFTGKKHTPEACLKMSISRRGKPKHWASMKGKKQSDDTKRILSDQKKGSKNSFFGHKHSEETKKKMSQNANGGGQRWLNKPFDQLSSRQQRRILAKAGRG